MRKVVGCVCAAWLLGSGPALALEVDAQRVTATDLFELCNVQKSDDAYNAAIAFCFGYLDAVLDYHAALTAGPDFHPLMCPPLTTSRRAAADVFTAWAGGHARQLGTDTPVHAVVQALADKWPCSN